MNLSRFIKKDWNEIIKDYIDKIVLKIVQLYGSDSGQETNTIWDHKKILNVLQMIQDRFQKL